MKKVFLDASVFLRFLTGDDLKKQQAAQAFFECVEKKEVLVYVTDITVCSVVFVLAHPERYYKRREEIRELLSPLLSLENLKTSNRRVLLRALDIYATHRIDFIGALLKATMEADQADTIYSYDTDFDRFPDIRRKEPEELLSQGKETEEQAA